MPHAQLTLISHPLCPFVQRAAIVLLEKNVPFERINIDFSAKLGWFLALSQSGKVPLLGVAPADSTHATLFESTAICEYLNETQDGASLYSDDALSRAQQRAWAEFGVAALSDAWQFLNAKDLEMAESKKTAFRDKLHRLESMLRCHTRIPTSHGFLCRANQKMYSAYGISSSFAANSVTQRGGGCLTRPIRSVNKYARLTGIFDCHLAADGWRASNDRGSSRSPLWAASKRSAHRMLDRLNKSLNEATSYLRRNDDRKYLCDQAIAAQN
ncbi:glutathione S-transferase family protein [Pseudomonas zeae]|jgi:glutathione S-transferase|uniref:glutathione S-transferase family protein n=1 Tax=Pseudomonas zeae TaxID=2745510 RepID=UPI0039E05119